MPTFNDHLLSSTLATISTLPSLPHILIKLISICNSGKVDLKKATGIIQLDPALCCKILSLTPAGYSLRSRKIRSIEQAVMRAGSHAISNIAITSAVQEATTLNDKQKMFEHKMFWLHALQTAVVSGTIALRTGYHLQEEAFLAGLLHDIGKLFLRHHTSRASTAVYNITRDEPDQEMNGEVPPDVDHCKIGAELLSSWNIHNFIVDAVRYHHESEDRIKSALPLVKILYTANLLCRRSNRDAEKGKQLAQILFDFRSDDIDGMMVLCRRKIEEVTFSLDIEIDAPAGNGEALSPIDQEKIRMLSRKVKEYALMAGTLRSLMKADGQADFLNAVHQGLKTVFNVGNVIYFVHNQTTGSLKGKIPTESAEFLEIDDLTIPLDADKSLIVQSLKQGKVINSFHPPPESESVVMDREIIDFLGGSGLLCLPIVKHDEPIGVIAMAIDHSGLDTLSSQSGLLQMLSDVSSIALEAQERKNGTPLPAKPEPKAISYALSRKTRHEINNPLSIIKNYLKVLAHKLAEKQIAQDELKIINEEIDRVSKIINQIPALADDANGMNGEDSTRINTLLSDLAKLLKESLQRQSDIVLDLDLDPAVPAVKADKDRLKQVFINIIKNGIEAMPRGGRLTIQSRFRCDGTQHILHKDEPPQGSILVVITDEGTGISESVKDRLFEPNISTKGQGHAGLGLSIAHNIIKGLGGSISIDSLNQSGTRVTIELPLDWKQNTIRNGCTNVISSQNSDSG